MNTPYEYKLRYCSKNFLIILVIIVLFTLNFTLLIINTFYSEINPKSSSYANESIPSNVGALPFSINDKVLTKTQTSIRRTPPILEVTISSSVPQGTQGIITAGPIHAANTWWWQVDFGNKKKGWISEDTISKTGIQAAYVVATPTINPSTSNLRQYPQINSYRLG